MTNTTPKHMEWTPTRIKALRERLGYTQDEMAKALGYGSYQRVSELENEKRPVTKQVARLLDMLNKEAKAA